MTHYNLHFFGRSFLATVRSSGPHWQVNFTDFFCVLITITRLTIDLSFLAPTSRKQTGESET
jgi:hypothetical protein